MAKYLYISTDSEEAKAIVGGFARKYHSYDIDANTGEKLVSRIGFNPMCSMVFSGVDDSYLEAIATTLVKEGLFVAFEHGNKIKKYQPSDMALRDSFLKRSLREKDHAMASLYFIYSNKPDKFVSEAFEK